MPKFVNEYATYTQDELRTHIQGNSVQGSDDGHPFCPFCKEAFYDSETLWLHKYNNHECCKVCVMVDDNYQFFGNYRSLSKHYKQRHFQCNDAVCLAEKHVVFASQLELQEHMVAFISIDLYYIDNSINCDIEYFRF